MGRAGSDGEEEFCASASISKRFKLPRKLSDDCNSVDHAAVPRRLRSAMKKRIHELTSPPQPEYKRPNHGFNGVGLARKVGIKKSKLNKKRDRESSPSQTIVGSITKDEEEVVEALSALAEMFPFPDKTKETILDGESIKEKSSPSPEEESSKPAFEESGAPKTEEASKSLCPSTVAAAVNPFFLEGSPQESVLVKCSNETSWPCFQNATQLPPELYNAISLRMPMSSKDEHAEDKQSYNSVGCNVQSEPRLGSLEQPKHEEATYSAVKQEIAAEQAAVVSGQHERRHALNDNENNGLALWPGLSSPECHGAGTQGPSFQLSAAKIPAWLGQAASSTHPSPLDNGVLTNMDSRSAVATKKWKKCAGHAYICHLINILKVTQKRDLSITKDTRLTLKEESKPGLLLAASNVDGVRNGLNEVVSAHRMVYSDAEEKPNEANAAMLHKRLIQDQQQACTSSTFFNSQKKNIDFLSLSAGGGGADAGNGTNRPQNGLEQLTQFHIPYMQSLPKNHTIMPFSLPQNSFSSAPSTDHLSVAAAKQVQLQPPPYMSSPLMNPSHLGSTPLPKRQQQWIWTTQLATQYKPMGLTVSHVPALQKGGQDPSPAIHQCAQFAPPPSHSSLEVLGPKYASFSQQQLISVNTSSLPTAIAKRQHHHLPSGFEVNAIPSYADTPLPLQLLCNDQV